MGETWPVTVMGRLQTQGVWEQVVRRLFGPKRDEVAGSWRKQHNEKIRDY
jgi:hypothetical protein